jgi:hypothetical protein
MTADSSRKCRLFRDVNDTMSLFAASDHNIIVQLDDADASTTIASSGLSRLARQQEQAT